MKRPPEARAETSIWPQLLEPVVQWRRQIVGAVMLAGITAACILWLVPNRYVSTARLLPETQSSGFSSMLSQYSAGLLESAGLGGAAAVSGDESGLYVEIMRSDYVRDRVLEYRYQMPDGDPPPLSLYDYLDVSYREEAYAQLDQIAALGRDGRSGIVTIAVETTDPELSAQVAQQFVSALAEYNATQRKTALAQVEQFLFERLGASHDELLAAEEVLADFQTRNQNYAATDDPELARDLGRLTRDVELKNTTYLTLNQQYLLARIEAQKEVPSFQTLDKPRPATLKSGPRRVRGTLIAALSVGLFLVGMIIAIRWLMLLLSPDESTRLKAMAKEVSGDLDVVMSRIRRPTHVRR